jgi:hypothetical protein
MDSDVTVGMQNMLRCVGIEIGRVDGQVKG